MFQNKRDPFRCSLFMNQTRKKNTLEFLKVDMIAIKMILHLVSLAK